MVDFPGIFHIYAFRFFMTGVLHAFVQPEQVLRYPGKGRVRPVLLSGADQDSRIDPAGYFACDLDLKILQEQQPLFMPAAGTMNRSAAC